MTTYIIKRKTFSEKKPGFFKRTGDNVENLYHSLRMTDKRLKNKRDYYEKETADEVRRLLPGVDEGVYKETARQAIDKVSDMKYKDRVKGSVKSVWNQGASGKTAIIAPLATAAAGLAAGGYYGYKALKKGNKTFSTDLEEGERKKKKSLYDRFTVGGQMRSLKKDKSSIKDGIKHLIEVGEKSREGKISRYANSGSISRDHQQAMDLQNTAHQVGHFHGTGIMI